MDWIAFTAVEGVDILAGTASVGTSTTNEMTITISHEPFSADPIVMATAR